MFSIMYVFIRSKEPILYLIAMEYIYDLFHAKKLPNIFVINYECILIFVLETIFWHTYFNLYMAHQEEYY